MRASILWLPINQYFDEEKKKTSDENFTDLIATNTPQSGLKYYWDVKNANQNDSTLSQISFCFLFDNGLVFQHVGKPVQRSPQDLLIMFISKPKIDLQFAGAESSITRFPLIEIRTHYLCFSGSKIVIMFDLNLHRVFVVEDGLLVVFAFAPFNGNQETKMVWERANIKDKIPFHKNMTTMTKAQMMQRDAAKLNALLDAYPIVKN